MREDLLIPKPKRGWESHLVTFTAVALLVHALGYVWISQYTQEAFRKHGSLVHVHMLNEVTPPPKPKLKPPPIRLKNATHVNPKPVAPLLHVDQIKFHPSHQDTSKEPSNFQSIEEPKGGSDYGNPEGIPGGNGSIGDIPAKPLPPPPLLPIVPDRKNPAVLSRCQPPYPDYEREQGIEGTVGLLVVVGRKGEIKDVSIARSSGNASLDRVAVENVKECWKFAPAIQNGEGVEARLTFSIVFRLQ